MLGLIISTYKLTVSISDTYVHKVLLLLSNTWHSGRRGAIGYSWLDGLLRNPWSGVQTPPVLGYSGLRTSEPLVRGSSP
jgi:hypothetical protein